MQALEQVNKFRKTTVELSTMDFDGLMAFVGGELEMAA
jgi:hypothetical protein